MEFVSLTITMPSEPLVSDEFFLSIYDKVSIGFIDILHESNRGALIRDTGHTLDLESRSVVFSLSNKLVDTKITEEELEDLSKLSFEVHVEIDESISGVVGFRKGVLLARDSQGVEHKVNVVLGELLDLEDE
ncbi:hypothetical protein KW882_02465 [Vibrio parahaemolyticus]